MKLAVRSPGVAEAPAADPLEELAQRAARAAGLAPRSGDPTDRIREALQLLESRLEAAESQTAEQEHNQDRLEGTIRALRAATRVTENVSSAFQRERVLGAIPDALMRSFGAAMARVWLVGPGDRCGTCTFESRCQNRNSCLHLVEHGGLGSLDTALARVPIGEYSVGRVAAMGGLVASNDLAREAGLADPDWARIEGLKSFAGHPLVHEGRLLGVVAMWGRELVRDEVLEALRILARHAATAIAGAQLIEEVREQSTRSQSATRRLQALLEASRSGVIMFDRAGRSAYVNGSFRRLFTLGDARLEGLELPAIESLLGPRLSDPAQTALATIAEQDHELLVRVPGEDKPRVLRRYSALVQGASGEPLGWMDVFDDVTHAHEVDRMKSEFISTVSHELRTPLTSIKGSLALLLDGAGAPLDEEAAELVSVSKRNADRLVRLVSDILDVSKIEAGKLELSLAAHAPADLCRLAVSGIDGFAQKVGVRVQLELEPELPKVAADEDRIVQVLTNLLSNALKFSPRGSSVTLAASRAAAGVVFAVRDEGPGIPAAFRDKLFTKFAQSDRARREQEGTGLGLAISRALVQIHKGTIWVESEPGEGATFLFSLPVS